MNLYTFIPLSKRINVGGMHPCEMTPIVALIFISISFCSVHGGDDVHLASQIRPNHVIGFVCPSVIKCHNFFNVLHHPTDDDVDQQLGVITRYVGF